MNMSNEEYARFADEHAPKSKTGKNMLLAFVSGGLICCIGQAFIYLYLSLDMPMKDARTAASITLVFISAVLTVTGLYAKLAKRCGAGTLVPITGFANSVVSPAVEFKTENFINGVGSKMFIIAGPVIVYGVVASVIYGLIYWLFLQL